MKKKSALNKDLNPVALFVKEQRRKVRLTQVELALKAGVGLRFVRDLEQGKETVMINKVNQVLALFGNVCKVGWKGNNL